MPFKKGQSGNPSGKPKKLVTAQDLRDKIANDIPEVLAVVVEQAKAGDMAACKLLLERCYPAIKPQALPINIQQGEGLTETSANVINDTFNGKIAPDIASMLITILANQAKINEQTEILKRLEALENGSNNTPV